MPTSAFDMTTAIGDSLTGITGQVTAILGVVAPAALAITAGFIGLRMALKAFRSIGR